MPLGEGVAAIASLHGSTITISRPPRMTNWSIAYSVASDRFCASATSSTWMSGSITCASVGDGLHLVGLPQQHGRGIGLPAGGACPRIAIIIVRGSPSSGSDDITPTTGRFGFDSS